jgi:hypothetical protein
MMLHDAPMMQRWDRLREMLVCASEGADAQGLELVIHNHHSTAAKQLNASHCVSATTSPPSFEQ